MVLSKGDWPEVKIEGEGILGATQRTGPFVRVQNAVDIDIATDVTFSSAAEQAEYYAKQRWHLGVDFGCVFWLFGCQTTWASSAKGVTAMPKGRPHAFFSSPAGSEARSSIRDDECR